MGKDLKFVQLNMSLSVGPSRRNMMLKMMLFLVQLFRMRSVLMSLLVTPPSPSAQSGPEKFALLRRSLSRSTLPSLDVPRSPERCVLLLAVDLRRELKFVMIRPAQLSRMLPRKNVALSPKNLCSCNQTCPQAQSHR